MSPYPVTQPSLAGTRACIGAHRFLITCHVRSCEVQLAGSDEDREWPKWLGHQVASLDNWTWGKQATGAGESQSSTHGSTHSSPCSRLSKRDRGGPWFSPSYACSHRPPLRFLNADFRNS